MAKCIKGYRKFEIVSTSPQAEKEIVSSLRSIATFAALWCKISHILENQSNIPL
jgi:hypothetical protein